LRLHLASPGGACSFDTPLYHYWLQQTPNLRQEIISDWLNDFTEIRTAVTLVLELVRNNAKIEDKTAVHGFHQELLDPQSNLRPQSTLRMIRIGIPLNVTAFPEISIGRHFLSIRFYLPSIDKRPTQYTDNLDFSIAYCNS
jgi:cell division protein ZapD